IFVLVVVAWVIGVAVPCLIRVARAIRICIASAIYIVVTRRLGVVVLRVTVVLRVVREIVGQVIRIARPAQTTRMRGGTGPIVVIARVTSSVRVGIGFGIVVPPVVTQFTGGLVGIGNAMSTHAGAPPRSGRARSESSSPLLPT